MITLGDLARLYGESEADSALPVAPVSVSDEVLVGDGPVTVMGVVNLSRDSTYRESVAVSVDAAVRSGMGQAIAGASIIDLGAEASHDSAERVTPSEQISRLVPVVQALSQETVVSVETYYPEVVEAVLAAGARMINLTGSQHDRDILPLIADAEASLLMCFSPGPNVRAAMQVPDTTQMIANLIEHFEPRLALAREHGVDRVVVDPGSGFTFDNVSGVDKARVQAQVLLQTVRLRRLGVPAGHALPHCFDLFEAEFRHAEGFFAVLAALGSAHLLRVHEVARVLAVLRALDQLEAP